MEEEVDCRICLNHTENSEQLIQPCACSSSYVHQSCLQRWRRQNINNHKYHKCEICNARYIIERNVSPETFSIEITYANRNHFVRGRYGRTDNNIPFVFPFYLIILSTTFISYCADELLDQNTVSFINGGEKNSTFTRKISVFPMGWVVYYSSFSSFLILNSILLGMLTMPICKMNRKIKYYKLMFHSYCMFTIFTLCYPMNIIFSYKIMNSISTFMLVNIIYFFTSYFATISFIESHNKTILLMNRDNTENIVSFNYRELESIDIQSEETETKNETESENETESKNETVLETKSSNETQL